MPKKEVPIPNFPLNGNTGEPVGKAPNTPTDTSDASSEEWETIPHGHLHVVVKISIDYLVLLGSLLLFPYSLETLA